MNRPGFRGGRLDKVRRACSLIGEMNAVGRRSGRKSSGSEVAQSQQLWSASGQSCCTRSCEVLEVLDFPNTPLQFLWRPARRKPPAGPLPRFRPWSGFRPVRSARPSAPARSRFCPVRQPARPRARVGDPGPTAVLESGLSVPVPCRCPHP